MNKQVIESYLKDYLIKKGYELKKVGQQYMFQCPYCKNAYKTALIPPNCKFMNCFTIGCSSKGQKKTIFDIVRDLEKIDNEDAIIHHIKTLLNLNIITEIDKDEVNVAFKWYNEQGFSLVPVAKNGKNPVEQAWTSKIHKDIDEWKRWHSEDLNFGIKTGQDSNLTVIDIDTKEIAPELLALVGDTYYQETDKGRHYFYHYTPDLPKTRINDLKIDIETTGGQVICYPSIINGIKRSIGEIKPIIDMPIKLLEYLKNKITVPLKTFSEKLKEEIATENFKINPEAFKLKNGNLDGCCNSEFIKLGGILRKELSVDNTKFVMNVLNRHMLEKPMEQKHINAMVKSLEKYISFEESDLAHRIITYLRDVEEANRTEIAMALMGTSRGEEKMRVDRALKYLVKEQVVQKKGSRYILLAKMDWETSLINRNSGIDFKFPYFHDVANIEWGDLILIGGKTKVGKCFKKDTKILMKDGTSKNVQDIQEGDIVQGINNQGRKVLDICQGYGKLYEIKPIKSEPFVVNGEHILCLVHTSTEEKITMSVNDYIKQNKTFKHLWKLYSEPVDWVHKDVELDPYFMGLWLGDGSSDAPHITTKDEEIKKYLENFAVENHLQCKNYSQPHKCPTYALATIKGSLEYKHKKNKIKMALQRYNVINNKHIPFDYKINDRETRLKLLAGLVDSDGYLNKKGNYEFSFVNQTLAKDVIFLARSLGFSAKLKKDKAMFNTWRYRFIIVGDTTLIPSKLKRRQSNKKLSIKNPLNSGFKITELPSDNYYGFVLDGDHLFLLESFIVNHNTALSLNIVKRLVDQGLKPQYISLESGSRFKSVALKLGLKDGDFCYNKRWVEPLSIQFEKKKVILVDWLCPESFADVDKIFKHFTEQLHKTDSILIVLMQLKETDGSWFSRNLVMQFPALSARYIYDDPKEEDGTYGTFHIDTMRDPKVYGKKWKIPCKYNFDTKILNRLDEIEENKNEANNYKPVSEEINLNENNEDIF